MDKNQQDAARAGSADDVMGVRHGGGRDQYGGSLGPGQSSGGAYPNPHSGKQGDDDAGGASGEHGGQMHVGYYGGGQMGGRSHGGGDHHAGATYDSPDTPTRTYADDPRAQGAEPPKTDIERQADAIIGADDHAGFGSAHQGQHAQGRQSGTAG